MKPRLRASATATLIPFLLMIRIPFLDTRNFNQRFSSSTQNFNL